MEKNVLIVTIKSDEVDEIFVEKVKQQFKEQLPNHDVAVFAIGTQDEVSVTEIRRNPTYKEES